MLYELTAPGLPRVAGLFPFDYPNHPLLFAFLEGNAPGRAFVDHLKSPRACLIVINYYRFSFVGGALSQPLLDAMIALIGQIRPAYLIVPPGGLGRLTVDRRQYEPYPRLEFPRGGDDPALLDSWVARTPQAYTARRMDHALLERCRWREEIVQAHGSIEAFLSHGLGCVLTQGDTIVSEVYAAFYGRDRVEIGAVTSPAYRGRGLAAMAGARVLRECRRQGKAPYWNCNQSNGASAALARKLGFQGERSYEMLLFP